MAANIAKSYCQWVSTISGIFGDFGTFGDIIFQPELHLKNESH
jgi:hypothetical protein